MMRRSAMAVVLMALLFPTAASAQTTPEPGVWQSSGQPAIIFNDTSSNAAADANVTLFTSRVYTADSSKPQHFIDNFQLKRLQELLPISLTIKNGIGETAPFSSFRLSVGGYLLASEADMAGARVKTIDVTGKIPAGMSQVIVDADGKAGASLVWSLSSPKIKLQSVHPKVAKRGQEIILTGDNFSSQENQDVVYINNSQAPILSASKTSITAIVPKDARLGDGDGCVVVDGLCSEKLPISVKDRDHPVLYSVNYWMAPPGATLTITGDHFSENPGDNHVFFGNVQANLLGATEDTLIVTVPEWSYGSQQLNIPLYVISDGVRSSNQLPFDIGPKYLAAPTTLPGDSYARGLPDTRL